MSVAPLLGDLAVREEPYKAYHILSDEIQKDVAEGRLSEDKLQSLFQRHHAGDWGTAPPEVRNANDFLAERRSGGLCSFFQSEKRVVMVETDFNYELGDGRYIVTASYYGESEKNFDRLQERKDRLSSQVKEIFEATRELEEQKKQRNTRGESI